jgi:tetratricopeptide (TPR) repeat protein
VGLEYQRRAEASFRARDYDQAARLANHAAVEMPRHGKHFLFLSQALFAVGDYRGAAAAAQQGMALADSKGWGDVVKDYRRYYTGTDYGDQLKRLEGFVAKNPDAGYARFLLGYHYGFLGYPAQARRELSKAVELESRDEIATRLLELFGGQWTARSADSNRTKPEPTSTPETSEPTNEPVEYSPPRVPAKPQ